MFDFSNSGKLWNRRSNRLTLSLREKGRAQTIRLVGSFGCGRLLAEMLRYQPDRKEIYFRLQGCTWGGTIPSMFERAKEYLKYGVARPLGTIWSMERAYFEIRHKYPGKLEYAYLRLSLQSRYPDKSAKIQQLVSDCQSLDDAIVKAVALDFGHAVAAQVWVNVLQNLPACSHCGKYRALSLKDDLCYGCRQYPGFVACTKCRTFWDDGGSFCQRCGERLWKITDGPGVSFNPMSEEPETVKVDVPVSEKSSDAIFDSLTADSDEFVRLVAQVDALEDRCARVWNASLEQRREYRKIRKIDVQGASDFLRQKEPAQVMDKILIEDLDRFFDSLCTMYLGANSERRGEIRSLMESNKRVLGNLHNYAGRAAQKLSETASPEFLIKGLAATSIDDGRSCQEFGYVLGRLYKEAFNHGLEPNGFFHTVATFSDNEMRGVLENFESSEDFAVFVKPYLGRDEVKGSG